MNKADRQKRIESFVNLKQGWNSYDAPPIDAQTIMVATQINESLPDYWDVIPSTHGGIEFEYGDIIVTIEPTY